MKYNIMSLIDDVVGHVITRNNNNNFTVRELGSQMQRTINVKIIHHYRTCVTKQSFFFFRS